MRIELEHRHQFDCSHAELLQIRDFLDQARKGAASFLCDAGARMTGEAAHMHFVDDRLRRRPVKRRVAFPIVRTRLDHHTFHGRRAIVAFLPSRFATVILRNNGGASIWIEEDFGRIESHSTRRIVGPLSSIAVYLPCSHARHKYVPVVIRAVG